MKLVKTIADALAEALPADALIVLPIGLGGHVDHKTVVQAGQLLAGKKHYFADYPYILIDFDNPCWLKNTTNPCRIPLGRRPCKHGRMPSCVMNPRSGEFWRDATKPVWPCEITWLAAAAGYGIKKHLPRRCFQFVNQYNSN